MILVKNKLKKIKTTDDDDMLHYLKYSHLNKDDDDIDFLDDTEYEDKATQFPDIKNKSTQTNFKIMEDKETDTYDELHEIIGAHFLKGYSEKLKSEEALRGNFAQQARSYPYITKSKETSSSSSSSSDDDFLSRNIKRGVRLTEIALNTASAGANVTMSMVNAMDTVAQTILFGNQNNDEENHDEVPEYVTSNTAHGNNNHAIAISVNSQFNNTDEVISVDSSPPLTVSSASPPQTVHSSEASVPTSPQSIPVPTSPQSSRASSRSSSKASSIHSPHKKHK